jgi:hypothetical protein
MYSGCICLFFGVTASAIHIAISVTNARMPQTMRMKYPDTFIAHLLVARDLD